MIGGGAILSNETIWYFLIVLASISIEAVFF